MLTALINNILSSGCLQFYLEMKKKSPLEVLISKLNNRQTSPPLLLLLGISAFGHVTGPLNQYALSSSNK